MSELQQLEKKIQKMYVESGEYKFKDEQESTRFVKNAAYYVESAYQDEGHYHYKTLLNFFYDSKADAIIFGVATGDYEWFK